MKNTVLGLIAILIIAGAGWWFYQQGGEPTITTFTECAAAGHPVMESYPRQCLTPDGRTLVEEVATSTPLIDGAYQINVETSTLNWEGGKTFIPGYTDRGGIKLASGQIGIVDGQPATGQVVVDMTSITASETSNESGALSRLVEHLKSDDFFAVATYPTATFSLTGVTAGTGVNQFILTGNLTVRGVTEPIQIPAIITQQNDTVSLVGEATVNRALYGVEFGSDSLLTGLADSAIIDDEFKLIFSLQATAEAEATNE